MLNQLSWIETSDAIPVYSLDDLDIEVKDRVKLMSHRIIDTIFDSQNSHVTSNIVYNKKSQALSNVSITEEDIERIRYENIQ